MNKFLKAGTEEPGGDEEPALKKLKLMFQIHVCSDMEEKTYLVMPTKGAGIPYKW